MIAIHDPLEAFVTQLNLLPCFSNFGCVRKFKYLYNKVLYNVCSLIFVWN